MKGRGGAGKGGKEGEGETEGGGAERWAEGRCGEGGSVESWVGGLRRLGEVAVGTVKFDMRKNLKKELAFVHKTPANSLQKDQACVVCFREFVELALKDIERFKRQKVKDLKDVFTNYCILQIERCKKVSRVSSHVTRSVFGPDVYIQGS